jgi:hypothetical protein
MKMRRKLRAVLLIALDVVLVYVAFPYYAASDLRKGLMEADERKVQRWTDGPALLQSLQQEFPQTALTLTPFLVRAVIADGVPDENSVTPITLGHLRRAWFDDLTTFRVVYNQQTLLFRLSNFWWRLTSITSSNLPPHARLAEPAVTPTMPADVPVSEEIGPTTLVARVIAVKQSPAPAVAASLSPAPAAPTPAPAIAAATATRIRARMADAEQRIRGFAQQHARELAQLYPGPANVPRNRQRLDDYMTDLRDQYRAKVAKEFGVGEVDVELVIQAVTNTAPARSAP